MNVSSYEIKKIISCFKSTCNFLLIEVIEVIKLYVFA